MFIKMLLLLRPLSSLSSTARPSGVAPGLVSSNARSSLSCRAFQAEVSKERGSVLQMGKLRHGEGVMWPGSPKKPAAEPS